MPTCSANALSHKMLAAAFASWLPCTITTTGRERVCSVRKQIYKMVLPATAETELHIYIRVAFFKPFLSGCSAEIFVTNSTWSQHLIIYIDACHEWPWNTAKLKSKRTGGVCLGSGQWRSKGVAVRPWRHFYGGGTMGYAAVGYKPTLHHGLCCCRL